MSLEIPGWSPSNPATSKLMADVKGRFGSLKVDFLDNISPSSPGMIPSGTVDITNGNPVIKVSKTAICAETTLVHELHHLVLRHQGFPCVFSVQPTGNSPQERHDRILQTFSALQNMVHHRIFFPKMTADGFSPCRQANERVRNATNEKDIEGLSRHDRSFKIYSIFECISECDDIAVLNRFTSLCRNKGMQAEYEIAKAMVEMANKANPDQPATCTQLIVELAEMIWRPFGVRFSIDSEIQNRHSDRFTERIPVVRY